MRGSAIAAIAAAARKNDSASTAIAQPGLVAATIRPPSAAPRMFVELSERRSSAFASCRIVGLTTCGMIPALAGMKNANERPFTAASAASEATLAVPVRSRTAVTAWLAPLTAFEPTMTMCRGSRSPSTPPSRMEQTVGTMRVASTTPSSVGEPCSVVRTPKASATGAIELPRRDVVRATKRRRKSRSRSGPSRLTAD